MVQRKRRPGPRSSEAARVARVPVLNERQFRHLFQNLALDCYLNPPNSPRRPVAGEERVYICGPDVLQAIFSIPKRRYVGSTAT